MSKPKPKYINLIVGIAFTAGLIQAAEAQDVIYGNQDRSDLSEVATNEPVYYNQPIRNVQPVAYWVDAKSLRVRDNPVAGKIVGSLDYGQKIMAYAQYENWIRVTKDVTKNKWVNSDFLSSSRLSWASYNRNTPTRSSDVIAVRIKDPVNPKNRIFGVRLKTADAGNRLITTRQNTEQGVFYQNHFVSCDEQLAIGTRLIGEGNSFLLAQYDVRSLDHNIYDPAQIEDKVRDRAENAISAFACKAQPF